MESLPSSFRDPSGFMFSHGGVIYRQVNQSFKADFDAFMESGLYERLTGRGLLVAHEEIESLGLPESPERYKILKPQQIPFISYPYEWSFHQLKDAAMATLKVQAEALSRGFVLKDASAFNIQFIDAKPVFIDTLSFEPYVEGTPWVAYKQFCQHFLAPLALMAHRDVALSKLMISHIDGIPLPLASELLPLRSYLNFGLLSHIHLHSRMQQNYSDAAGEQKVEKAKKAQLSARGLRALVESLASAVNKLQWKRPRTEWGEYYDNTNYTDAAGAAKRQIVGELLAALPEVPRLVQDVGANNGEFSLIAAGSAGLVVSQDIDPVAVDDNYLRSRDKGPANILPLVQNFCEPSPAIGWANTERNSFPQRSEADLTMALALVHHLAISNNTPLDFIAAAFANISPWLIIEFVPKSDSQVERLLATREDIFPAYNKTGFEEAFLGYFSIEQCVPVPESERHLYLMKRKGSNSGV